MSSHDYRYGGARALVELHERHLRQFLIIWKEADARAIALPESSDPNRVSREALLAHVLGCAARYLTWICEQMRVAAPEIEQWPEPKGLTEHAEDYLEKVLAAWRWPLASLREADAYEPAYESRWGRPTASTRCSSTP
ncbi:MAG: hypothetical protein ACE5GX_09660 [Thermoanaerobaculia bacterium]